MKTLKMGMVGGGIGAFVGKVHRMGARMIGGIEVAAGCFNRDKRQNDEIGAKLGVAPSRRYASFEAMIAGESALPPGERVDFISICTPNYLHYGEVKLALEAGFHVMDEKPMTMTVDEALELEKLVKKTKRVFGLMHTYTGYPMVKRARDLVKSGEVGKVEKVVVEYPQGSFRKMDFTVPLAKLDKRNKWKMNPKTTGESCCMGDIGVHAANMLEYVTGLEIREVLSDLHSFTPGIGRLEDDGDCLLRLSKGARGVLIASKIATGEENGFRFRVYGTKKGLFWQQESPNVLHVAAQRAPEQIWKRGNPYVAEVSPAAARASNTPSGHPEGYVAGFANIYRNFADTIRAREDGRKPTELELDFPGVREGIRGMRFIEAVLKSSRAGNAWTAV